MVKSRGKHARRRFRVGAVFAVEAILVQLLRVSELEAATVSHLGEYAADGAR